LALTLLVTASLATQSLVPADIKVKLLRLHAPEFLGLKADYIKE